ncbi:MAG: AbiU2 domain-containing protein [Promethearchaeota archaeon]
MDEDLRERFIRYRKSLINTYSYGLIHLKVLGALFKYFEDNTNDHSRLSPLFFRTTEDAHFENFLSYIFRIFDFHKNALSIDKFLNFINANPNILFPNDREAVILKIREDKQSLEEKQSLLNKLKTIRNKAHFHLDTNHAGNYMQVYKRNYIPVKELEKLVKLVLKIVNFYSNIFDGREVKFDLDGLIKNDVDDLFIFINRGRKAFENEPKNIE